MTKSTIPIKIKDDYLILPLTLPTLPSLDSAPATHYLYLRRHQPRVPTPDDARTLFAANLPADATTSQLRALFSALGGGRLESLSLDTGTTAALPPAPVDNKKRKRAEDAVVVPTSIATWDRSLVPSGSTGTLRFVDSESATLTLRAIESHRKSKAPAVVLPEAQETTGLARYAAHHRLRFPSAGHLQSAVDGFMAAFDEREEEARRAAARRRQEPDEDGFIMVGRGGRQKGVAMEEAERKKVELEKRKEDLKGFYRFQVRDEKKKRQVEMLKKFEEDKKRVEERKRGRRFIPE